MGLEPHAVAHYKPPTLTSANPAPLGADQNRGNITTPAVNRTETVVAEHTAATPAVVEEEVNDFETWIDKFRYADTGSAEETLARTRMIELAKTSDDWQEILDIVSEDSPIHTRAVEELLKNATTLEELEALYDKLGDDDPAIDKIVEKIKTCTEPVEDWLDMYESRSNYDSLTSALLDHALSVAKTSDDFEAILDKVDGSDIDCEKVWDTMHQIVWTKEQCQKFRDGDSDAVMEFGVMLQVQFLETAPEAVQFYLDYVDEFEVSNEVTKKIFEKLFSLTTRQEAQIIAKCAENDDLKEAAAEHIAK